jgi:hypothetical protein
MPWFICEMQAGARSDSAMFPESCALRLFSTNRRRRNGLLSQQMPGA